MLFVVRPGDDNQPLRQESRVWIVNQISGLRYQMNTIESELEKTYADPDSDTEQGKASIEFVEAKYATVVAQYQNAQLKLQFEDRDWGRPRVRPTKAMRKPWDEDPKAWAEIFKNRLY